MLLGGLALAALAASVILCVTQGAFSGFNWLWMLPVGFIGGFLIFFLLAFLFLWFICAIVDDKKVREKDSPFYRGVATLYVKAVIQILRMHVHTEGMEQLPKDGRFMMVCNHLNILDPVTLLAFFPDSQLAFISKRENNSMFIVGKLMHMLMCQLINRENDREALKTIINCIHLIKEDKVSIAVFPEGYTSLDEKLHPFRPGVFKIAQKANVPIVVCTVQNTQHVFHNVLHFRHTDVPLHLLGVIPAEELKGVTTVDISNRIHQMMAEDLGPENVLPADNA